jgi:hypothetical protein
MIIPTNSDGTAFWTQRTNLDGSDYQLEFQWSTRQARWYLNLYDSDGNLLIGSVKLILNWPLFRHYHGRAGVPAGELWVISLGSSVEPPGFDELGAGLRCELTYFPAA